MIKAVVFDLWLTLGTKNMSVSSKFCERFGIEKTPEFMPKYEASIQLEKYESMDQLAEHMLNSFNITVTEEDKKFIGEIILEGVESSSLFPGMKELLLDLKKTCKIGVLSNTAVFEAHALQKWGVEDLFDAIVYSWQIGSLKPAGKNFETILEKLGVKAEECIFVDDNIKNRNAAENMGFTVLDSAEPEILRARLQTFDVDV